MKPDGAATVRPDTVVTAWRHIAACHAAASAALERALGERHGLGVSDFEVLERHGLVERCACDMDRRGIYVVLTDAGQRRHAEAVPTHREVLTRMLPADLAGAGAR